MSAAYSPRWCPDFTLLHGSAGASHILVDITVPSVVSRSALPVASEDPNAVAVSAEASKHATYGPVQPHVVLPFVVEDAGGLGPAAEKFLHCCKDKCNNELSDYEYEKSNWSSYGFSNYYRQQLAVANAAGVGHYMMVVAAILRTHGGVGF